jgi:Uma2 family endonuclease
MPSAVRLKSNDELLRELDALPASQTGEVIDGAMYVMGRPGQGHQVSAGEVWGTLRYGGPGGRGGPWVLYQEVSVRFATNEEVVPDVAGWRRERFTSHFEENPIRLTPDWVCEILSDSTRPKDLGPKRKLYGQQGVKHLWLVDPDAHLLEAFELNAGMRHLLGAWSEAEVVRGLAPFPELSFELAGWWLEGG